MLLALPTESKLFLVGVIDRDGKKGICQINSCIPGSRDVLICSSNEITSGIEDTFEVTICLSLTMIHCHSPSSICLLDSPDR